MGHIYISNWQGLGGMKWEGDEFGYKMATWGDPWGVGNALYLNTINANTQLWYYTAILQAVTTGGLFVLFLIYTCTYFTSKLKV